MDWKSEEMPKMIDGCQLKDIINVDETGLFYNHKPSKTLSYKGDSYHGGTKSKQRVIVLLGCNADDTEKLSPLVTGKYNSPTALGVSCATALPDRGKKQKNLALH
jgi:hypothetical protein